MNLELSYVLGNTRQVTSPPKISDLPLQNVSEGESSHTALTNAEGGGTGVNSQHHKENKMNKIQQRGKNENEDNISPRQCAY